MRRKQSAWVVHLIAVHPLASQQMTRLQKKITGFTVKSMPICCDETRGLKTVFVIDTLDLISSLESTVRGVSAKHRDARFVVITSTEALLSKGIAGWVFVDDLDLNLIPAVQAVISGLGLFPAAPIQALVKQQPAGEESGIQQSLTSREKAVHALLRRRLRNAEIAARLGIKES